LKTTTAKIDRGVTINFAGTFDAENDEMRVEGFLNACMSMGYKMSLKYIFLGPGLNLLPTARVLLVMNTGSAFVKNFRERGERESWGW
jgi:hypothetical protein